MTFVGGASSLYRSSPIGAAMAPKALDTPTQITAGDPPQAGETLFARLNIKLAELRGRGYRLQWMEMSQKEMITLFNEAGEEVIRLDPDLKSERGKALQVLQELFDWKAGLGLRDAG